MLKRIFGPKRDDVTGEWRRLHKEEPYALLKRVFGEWDGYGLSRSGTE